MTKNDRLDALIGRALRARSGETRADADAATRIVTALVAGPLPPQRRPFWTSWPAALLNQNFAPAWPRIAALAGCIVLGFLAGVGMDGRRFSPASGNVDLRAIAFEPEPLTGLDP
jgi:hypothetical protein